MERNSDPLGGPDTGITQFVIAVWKAKEANPRSREVMEKGTGNFGGVRREIGEINFRRIVVGRHSRLTFIDRTGKPQKTSAIPIQLTSTVPVGETSSFTKQMQTAQILLSQSLPARYSF